MQEKEEEKLFLAIFIVLSSLPQAVLIFTNNWKYTEEEVIQLAS